MAPRLPLVACLGPPPQRNPLAACSDRPRVSPHRAGCLDRRPVSPLRADSSEPQLRLSLLPVGCLDRLLKVNQRLVDYSGRHRVSQFLEVCLGPPSRNKQPGVCLVQRNRNQHLGVCSALPNHSKQQGACSVQLSRNRQLGVCLDRLRRPSRPPQVDSSAHHNQQLREVCLGRRRQHNRPQAEVSLDHPLQLPHLAAVYSVQPLPLPQEVVCLDHRRNLQREACSAQLKLSLQLRVEACLDLP